VQQQLNDLSLLQQREAKALARLSAEQEKSERLLLSLFPKAIAERLKVEPSTSVAEEYAAVTILFADIHDFWKVAGRLPPARLIELLNDVFSMYDRVADAHGVQKIKTIGDAYMAAAGLPEPRSDHAGAIAEMAFSMQREIAGLRTPAGGPFSVRIGIHSGPVVAGVFGTRRPAYDLWGPTVNLANQMESCGLPGEIQITSTTRALLGEKYLVEPRGEFYVKGQGAVETYLLKGRARR
jgi:class 3 adenylate cyclase